MKRILLMIFVPYLIIMAVIFYFYYGAGVFGSYTPFEWKGIKTMAPRISRNEIYQIDGWDVYYFQKQSFLIRIAVKPSLDNVSGFTQHLEKILFKYSPDSKKIFYISKIRKTFEATSAVALDDVCIFFSVSSPSAFNSVRILEKLIAKSEYKGAPILFPNPTIPQSAYSEDILLWAIIFGSLAITFIIISFSGRRPGSRYLNDEPIQFGESFVYFTRKMRWGRNSSFGYMALTSSRLIVFYFMKPIFECNLREGKPGILFEGKKIILSKNNERITVRPSNIDRWKELLFTYTGQYSR
jgi:hypothetical protein